MAAQGGSCCNLQYTHWPSGLIAPTHDIVPHRTSALQPPQSTHGLTWCCCQSQVDGQPVQVLL